MRIFSWVTKDTNINFMGMRKPAYVFSSLLVVLSVICIAVKGFNYGIDFSGGILMEVGSSRPVNLEDIRAKVNQVDLDDVNLQTVGETGTEFMIRAQAKELSEKEQMAADGMFIKTEAVLKAGVIASVIAILAISLYIWFRFEWQFALGALAGLVHDVLVTSGLLSLFDMDFSLTTVAAILTLAGYSVNDKVVTYDRIRENLRKFKKMPQLELLNKSINDIFSRTILTGLTTFLAALALFAFGGDTLRSFSFTIVAGVVVGTYSSIYVSAVLLNLFDLRATQEAKEQVINPFGNVD